MVECFGKAVDNAHADESESIKEIVSSEMVKLSGEMHTLCSGNNNIDLYLTVVKDKEIPLLEKCWGSTADYVNSIVRKSAYSLYGYDDNSFQTYQQSLRLISVVNKDAYSDYASNGFAHIDETKAALAFADAHPNIKAETYIECYKRIITITQCLLNAWGEETWCDVNGGAPYATHKYPLISGHEQKTRIDEIMEYHKKIKELDPNYTIPNRPAPAGASKVKNTACYIATAVYGSYDCPQVWTLRRFRDYTLAQTHKGRLFIRAYYLIIPKFIKLFGNTKWFNKFFKKKLNRLVSKLNKEGFSDKPYNDKR